MNDPINQLYDCLTYCEQQNGLPCCKNCGLDKAMIDKVVDTIRQEERRKTIEEIIENIPVCRDRITKCNCSDHKERHICGELKVINCTKQDEVKLCRYCGLSTN